MEILAAHDEIVRKEESSRIDALVDRIVDALGGRGETPPLEIGMGEASLSKSLEICFEREELHRLNRFVGQLSHSLGKSPDVLSTFTALACAAIEYGFDDIACKAMDAIYDFCLGLDCLDDDIADQKLSIAIACYEIGASMVGANRWELIQPFVNRQSVAKGNYVYASWIRECQVFAVRAGKFGEQNSGTLISLSLLHMKEHAAISSALGLDFPTDASTDGLSDLEERALDLLCSFDLLYCLCVYVAGDGKGLAYPACSGFDESRIKGVASKMFGSDASARHKLLPDANDSEIAASLQKISDTIGNQAMQHGRYAWYLSEIPAVATFLSASDSSDGAFSDHQITL